MKILIITANLKDKILKSYLTRHCEAWSKELKTRLKIYVPFDKAVVFFTTQKNLKSFVTHCADYPIKFKLKNVAEIYFRSGVITK